MRYDRDFSPRGSRPGSFSGRSEYDWQYEGPYPRQGIGRGYLGGSMRSRGSWYAGARRSRNEYEEAGAPGEFEWGGGYVGGRGYGGTNYDFEHGYATGRRLDSHAPRGGRLREGDSEFSSPASRGGYSWGEDEAVEEYGPARYGYGPYFERLRRRRRPDDEIRHEIEETLFFDTWVDADAISVAVADGVVTLSGTLPSYEELRFAVDDAWDVEGVRGVRSELDVVEAPRRARGQRQGQQERDGDWERHLHGHPYAGAGDEDESMQGSGDSEANARADERAVGRTSSRRSGRGEKASPGNGTDRGRRGQPAEAQVAGTGSANTRGNARGARARTRTEGERGGSPQRRRSASSKQRPAAEPGTDEAAQTGSDSGTEKSQE